MYSNEPIKFYKNRKPGPDAIVKWLDIASILTWFVLFFNLSLFFYARPGQENFLDRLLNVKVRNFWDIRLLKMALILSIMLFVISSISIYLNTKRLKRKYDRMRLSLIVSAVCSFIMMVFLIIFI